MNMIEYMNNALDYIEKHLTDELSPNDIAKVACCTTFHFQRMFQLLIGISLSEYIRRRRLTMAAFDLQNSKDKIIDIALRYGYQSPDSFTRAFQTLHGMTPSLARKQGNVLKAYPRLSFTLSIKGGEPMNYKIAEKPRLHVIGIHQKLNHNNPNLGDCVSKMWTSTPIEIYQELIDLNDIEPLGVLGIYAQIEEDGTIDYYIAVSSTKQCPSHFTKLVIEPQTYAVFNVTINQEVENPVGKTWERIFSEWFPTSGYEHEFAPEIEYHYFIDNRSEHQGFDIWIPVIKSNRE